MYTPAWINVQSLCPPQQNYDGDEERLVILCIPNSCMDGQIDPNTCFVFVKHLDSESSSFPPHAVDVLSYAVRLVSIVLCRTAPVYSPERLLLLEKVLENEKRSK
jgi:hypothetical protein